MTTLKEVATVTDMEFILKEEILFGWKIQNLELIISFLLKIISLIYKDTQSLQVMLEDMFLDIMK